MQRRIFKGKRARGIIASLAILVLVAACGGGSSTEGSGSAGGPTAVPTMPAAQFTAVAQQAAAESSVLTQTTVLTQPVGVDPQQLERGANIYVNRECDECHGAQGEGVPDKGAALAGTQLTLQEFDNILRTGGNGDLGPDHLYGPSAISPGGVEALHAWLQSLSAP